MHARQLVLANNKEMSYLRIPGLLWGESFSESQCAINTEIVSISWRNHAFLSFSLYWRHNERDCVSNHRRPDCLLNHVFRRRSKKTSKLHVTGLCEGNSPVPSQRSSIAENVSIWWRHHVQYYRRRVSGLHSLYHHILNIPVLQWARIKPGVGVTNAISHVPFFYDFSPLSNISYLPNITSIFDRCSRTSVAVTSVKYKGDSANLTGVFAQSTIDSADKLTKRASVTRNQLILLCLKDGFPYENYFSLAIRWSPCLVQTDWP